MAAQNVILKAKGLYSQPNALSEVPEGGLLQADNVVINRDSIVEPRRGFAIYGTAMGSSATNDVAKAFLIYKNRIIRHFSSTLQFDNGSGTFTSFTGSFSEVESGLRMKGIELNGNMYFTTSKGIKKITSASAATMSASQVGDAGMFKALDTKVSLNSTAGFLTQESKVAYRVVWGIKDANNNVILGSPSERAILTNALTDLLITNFNSLLAILDTLNNAGGIDAGNYISTLKVDLNSAASSLRSNLIALATALDNDIVITAGAVNTTNRFKPTVSTAKIQFNQDISTFLAVGDQVVISGLTDSELNGTFTITSISTTGVANDSINFSGTFTGPYAGPTADTGGSVKRNKYTLITQPVALSDVPTTTQLESMQTYYDAIVSQLQIEPTGIVSDPSVFDDSASTQSATANLSFTIPSGITTSHFYQVYRSALATSSGAISLSDIEPSDELGLVLEDNPTSSEISAGYVTIHDIVPDSFRGANLYTNPNSGEGIVQANEPPPKAKDLSIYKNFVFYGNTETRYNKQLALLSVSGLTSGVSTFVIKDGTTTNTYTFQTGVAEVTSITCVADVADSLNGKYFTINSALNVTPYYVWFKTSGGATSDPAPANKTGVRVDISTGATAAQVATAVQEALDALSDFTATVLSTTATVTNANKGIATNAADVNTTFTITTTTQGAGEDTSSNKVLISELATPAQQVDETARSLCHVINRDASGLVYAYYISGPDDVPGLIFFQARTLGNSAFYFQVNSTTTGEQFSPTLPTSGTTIISDNDVYPNRVYYSKNLQADAVPILNYFDVGPKDRKIIRILGLRESLFVFKEEGIYRVTGESAPFVVTLFDSSTLLTAPDTAVVLNNQIFALTDQGVAQISDTGVSIMSRSIETQFLKLNTPNYPAYSTASFAIASESDRSYLLFTVTNTSDTKATQCFRYNTFTNAWTRTDQSKTCGVVNTADDKIYLGAADINYIERERKSFDRTDYADREYSLTLGANAVNGAVITLPSLTNVDVRDVILQTQYLTIYQLNSLLNRLDNDGGVSENDYESTLNASPGDNLRTILTNLANKLDADPGVNDTNYAATISGYTSSFSDTQLAFNAIVNKLNLDLGVVFFNHPTSTGTTPYEIIIISKDIPTSKVTTEYAYPFIEGPITVFKHISCTVKWAPVTAQDPSVLKQFTDSTVIFEMNNFSKATVSYASDLNSGFDSIDFTGSGNGIFGSGLFGNNVFGGSGSAIPFRTYVPASKQRSRFIIVKFEHGTARELFSLYGLSLTVNPTSTRAYR